jgi:uncharacterized protein (TIGR02996 family)
MTTEDDFQAALDANPDDWQTRLVFADWLEERSDPRAEGYRALALLPSRPHMYRRGQWGFDRKGRFPADGDDLPSDWFLKLEEPSPFIILWHWSDQIRCDSTRRGIEDIAASAFPKLPAKRRARLLAVPALT